MKSRSIIERLFRNKNNHLETTIVPSRQVIKLGKHPIYIGRTPGRFVEFLGHQSAVELSIQDALEALDANRAAENIFPLAATPGSHWIYFALYSVCRQTPGRYPMKQYLYFLSTILNRRNTGIAVRVLNSSPTDDIQAISENYRGVLDIRRRIADSAERKRVISTHILERLDALVRSARKDDGNYRGLAKAFRYAWLHQSEVLRTNSHHVVVQEDAPGVSRIDNADLLRIYSGYWLIRALYGISLEENDDVDKAKRLDALVIRKSANLAQRYLRALFAITPGLKPKMEGVLLQLREAERTGDPPLIHEYYKKQAVGGRILNGFRLTRFWSVLGQLDVAVSRGLDENV